MKKLRICLSLFIFSLSFFIFSNIVFAQTAVINDPEGVNLRSGAGTNNSILTAIAYGKVVTLVSTDKVSGTGCSAGWYKVTYNSYTGYLCSSMVTLSTTSSTTVYNGYHTTTSFDTRISEDYASVRATAAYGNIIDTLYMGTKVKVLDKGSTWTKISYYNGKTGYVLTKLVKNYSDLTATDSVYYNTLRSEGFPESYLPFLTKLHQQHPNWIFKADKTNLDFSSAVSNETGKNYIQSTIDSYRISSVVAENPNWFKASASVVAVYLDPRNYLNETNIFAFERLSYSTTQTSSIVKNIFGSSYLSSDEYVNYFMDAGKTYNISPVHLAARVKQEGGTDANYDGVSGTSTLTYDGKSLKGYYNYYNIGAWQDSKTSSAVSRGLAVAAEYVSKGDFEGTPWNTREKAIKYGAAFIAKEYISKGQDSLYYQKFNVSSRSYYAKYTNQYMTNVSASASESLSTHDTYKTNGIIDIGYTFYIPVFNNMPNDFTALPPIGNTNNNLSDIKIDNATITGFDKDVIEYTYYVPYDKSSVNISATKEASTSSISGTGTVNLSNKITTQKIVVISETGDSKTYTITIVKQDKPTTSTATTIEDIINNIDVKFASGYLTGISVNTTATTLSNTIKEQNASANVVIKDKNGNVKINASLATNDKITIVLNNETKTYTISIKGDNNSDGKINSVDLLRIQKYILKYITLKDAELVASDNNYDGVVNSVDLLRTQKYILKYITFK